eukprot:6197550-Pleurochrysis_carterae.AAC.2
MPTAQTAPRLRLNSQQQLCSDSRKKLLFAKCICYPNMGIVQWHAERGNSFPKFPLSHWLLLIRAVRQTPGCCGCCVLLSVHPSAAEVVFSSFRMFNFYLCTCKEMYRKYAMCAL